MPRVHFVKKAQKDYPAWGIKKGDSYYWWKFRHGGMRRSKTRPTRQELTQSPFLTQVYDIEDCLMSFTIHVGEKSIEEIREELEEFIEGIVSDINDLQSECEESLDNMPEQLQESSASGQILQERIEMLEDWVSNLESIDIDIDEEDIEAKVEDILDEISSTTYEGG